MATSKKMTKKDLEDKITELESKIDLLVAEIGKNVTSEQNTGKSLSTTPSTKPKGTLPKGFEEKKPEPKKPEPQPKKTTKPKGTLPKGFEEKKPEPKKPEPQPKKTTKPKGTLPKGFEEKKPEPKKPEPAKTSSQPPATIESALEDAYYNAPQTDFHKYRATVTGYTPAPNRYHVRLTAPVGTVPTANWNDQKVKVTGYTQPSNQYFATRQRLAYHPPEKRFRSFSGVNMHVDGNLETVEPLVETTTKKPKGTLPKGF